MTLPEAIAIVRRLSYKPNFLITSTPRSLGGLCIKIQCEEASSTDPNQRIQLGCDLNLSKDSVHIMSIHQLIAAIRIQILKMERHEVDEWFHLDGERFDNPHITSAESIVLFRYKGAEISIPDKFHPRDY